MDLRNLPDGLSPVERIDERRKRIENELSAELSALRPESGQIGLADERNCEQMFGMVPVPVGLAGPLRVRFSSGETLHMHLPLATTEGALVASVNRGAKALIESDVRVSSKYIGITRSIAIESKSPKKLASHLRKHFKDWKRVGESTSSHLKILSYQIDSAKGILFLTIAADTDEAMGMNMVTIAAQAIADFVGQELGARVLTVAGNVDSDKKPSVRTKKLGRGYRVRAEAVITDQVIAHVLKSDAASLVRTARAKLVAGSRVAGALGANLHAANVVAALYLATGQDVAHVVEGSLCDTRVARTPGGIKITVDLPAVLVGVRGGGTELPAQKQALGLILRQKSRLKPVVLLAETIGAAVLAGELSLLAAQASNTLAKAHKNLARKG